MATIIVEDGTGKTDSNSYINEAGLTTYATDRGITLTAADDAAKAALLIQAMDYIENQRFIGSRATDTQALQWPRYYAFIDGFPIDSNEIPQLLIDALCEVAIGVDQGNNPLAALGRIASSEKVGEIAITYEKGTREFTELKAANAKLRKLIMGGGSSAMVTRV